MIIDFAQLATKKHPIKFIRRLFAKFEIPGAKYLSEDVIEVPDPIDPEKPQNSDCWIFKRIGPSKFYGSIKRGGISRSTHREMFEVLNKGIKPNLQVHHRCNCMMCCCFWHLKQGTPDENSEYMVSMGRQAYGERNSHHILTEVQVYAILDELESGNYKQKDLAQKYGVNRRTISDIAKAVKWKQAIQNWKKAKSGNEAA